MRTILIGGGLKPDADDANAAGEKKKGYQRNHNCQNRMQTLHFCLLLNRKKWVQ